MKYTKGSFEIKITEEFDPQSSKYVNVKFYSGKTEVGKITLLHYGDMEVVKNALVKYFESQK
jgi:hypothetical protein